MGMLTGYKIDKENFYDEDPLEAYNEQQKWRLLNS